MNICHFKDVEQAVERLKNLKKYDNDPEEQHAKAEEILLELIDEKSITELWQEMSRHWWYS